MVRRLQALALLVGAAIGSVGAFQGKTPQAGKNQSSQDHPTWVAKTLQRMQTVKPGMTREALLKVFTTEGGLSNRWRRTFVSRECPFFKVDVEFQEVGRPSRDREGRLRVVEDDRDIILTISRPYLQFTIAD